MSKSKPAPDPLGNNTRQMLDELDTLMEKMLALPVNHLEDGSPIYPTAAASAPVAVQEPVTTPPPYSGPTRPAPAPNRSSAQVLVGQLSVLHSPASAQASPDLESRGRKLAPSSTQAGETWTGSPEDDVLPPLVQLPAPMMESKLPAAARSAFRFHPLLWINQGFDLLTQRLGLVGSWLRSSRGRMMLGFLGLTLLALAAAWWLKDSMGWTWALDPLE